MDAVVVELKDFAVRTPEQVFRVFFKLYDGGMVRAGLWRVFGDWAAACGGEQGAEVAVLFDQLIALAEALEKLRMGDTAARCCVICGGKLDKGREEGG